LASRNTSMAMKGGTKDRRDSLTLIRPRAVDGATTMSPCCRWICGRV
jgi:hypothetical protein